MVSSKLPVMATANTAGNVPTSCQKQQVLLPNTAGNCPKVNLKISSGARLINVEIP